MLPQSIIERYKHTELGHNFNLWELIRSNYLDDITEPGEDIIKNLHLGVTMLLQPARDYINTLYFNDVDLPVIINSGYRNYSINEKCRGSKNSDHLIGIAYDIKTLDKKYLLHLFSFFAEYGYYRQLILYDTFIHVSYNHPNKIFKKQVLDLRS